MVAGAVQVAVAPTTETSLFSTIFQPPAAYSTRKEVPEFRNLIHNNNSNISDMNT